MLHTGCRMAVAHRSAAATAAVDLAARAGVVAVVVVDGWLWLHRDL